MQHARSYQVIISADDKIVFLIKPQEGKIQNPYIVYDDKSNHAFLYRHPRHVLLLDYLDSEVIPYLQKANEAVVIEADKEKDKVICDYRVKIKHEKYS
ncbi:MAG: hypothetical protein J6Y53_02230 [Alphaproteobacteria bacterium]|nr:hypothetical protein [Alphaproteobacteria bacterium]